DKDSEETVKSGAGKDSDEDDDEDDDDDDEEEETGKDDKETKETGTGGDEVREGSDEGVESIFTTTSSQSVSLVPPTPIMTPSTIATITTSGEAQIPPPTIPSIILENLLTFNSAFRFEERLRLLETSFNEYRQTNQVAGAVSAIPGIVRQYMDQQIKEAVLEAVQIQTDQLQNSLQRENEEFLCNIDENMKNVLKGLVKTQVKEQVSRFCRYIYKLDNMVCTNSLMDRTMAITIEQQVALDEALVPSTKRLRIGRSNFRLPSDIQSKEPTLQVVYDVLRGCPFFKAFLVTADVPEIYMQEFWATAYVHQYSIRFKMDSKKNIVDLEAFREMLHISPRVPGQSFDEQPFEKEILDFLRFLGHSAQIKTFTDVNVNKLFQPWRSFAANQKKSNEMYYPRFTKVIIHHFMTKKPSIPRRNKVNWHYVRDDIMFSTIKVVSRHQNTQQYGVILPIELTTEDIKNTKAYKEYYACATGEAAPKPKASARRKRGDFDSTTTPLTAVASPRPITTIAVAPRLTAATKGKQPAKAKRVPDVPSDDSEEEISWNSSDDEDVDAQDKGRDDDEGKENDESDDGKDDDDDKEEIAKIDEPKDTESGGDDEETESDGESEEEETKEEEEESFDPIPKTPEDSEDDGNGEEDQGLRVSEEQRLIKEEEADGLYLDVDINQGRGLQVSQDIEDSHVTLTPVKPDGQQESSSVSSFMTSMLNPISDTGVESIFTTTLSPIAPLQTPTPIMTPSTIAAIKTSSDAPIPPTTIPSEVLQNLLAFDSVFCFKDRVKSLEVNFSEFMQTNQFAEAVSNIPENDEFLRTIDENMKRIIKEQVKRQVKEQVSRILPRIEESVNDQLEAEVLIRSSHSSRTSYAVAADLTEMELKKILIEKMEGNKRREDDDDQEGPFAGSDRESKRRREDGEPESASTLSEPATRSAGRSTTGTQSRQMSASESAFAEEPHPEWFSQPKKPPTSDCDWNTTLPAAQGRTQLWISDLAKQADSRSSFNEILDTPIDFSNFIMNQLGVDTLTPELLAGPTYELIRGSCNSLTELEYNLEEVYKATTDQLDWINPEDYGHIKWIEDLVPRTMWIQEPINYDKHALWGVSHWGRKRQQFYGFAVNRESTLDVYSKRRIIVVTDLKIVEWHNYKHLD
nr:hypothetical protein [Tanacetum cinerariifolium]